MDDLNQASDPAAEFLAREQNELGELGDELGYKNQSENLNGDDNADQANNGETNASDVYSSVRNQDVMQTEPEKITIWRQEFKSRIEKKDEEEIKKKEMMEAAAKKELMDWRRHYQEQMVKGYALNREHDASMLAERENKSQASAGQGIWERVCRLCEFNPPKTVSSAGSGGSGKVAAGSGGTVLSGTKDVSRMRSVLLQLKQQPLVR